MSNKTRSVESGWLLSQVRPSGTSAEQAFVSATQNAEILLIKICNTTAADALFSIYHDDTDGVGTYDEATALHFEQEVPAKTTVTLSADSIRAGFVIRRGGTLGVKTSVASALTFSFYGVLEDGTRRHER